MKRIWQSFKAGERGGIARINLSEWSAAFALAVGLWFLLDWLLPDSDWAAYLWFFLVFVLPLMLWAISGLIAEKRQKNEETSRLPPNVHVIPPGEDLETLAANFESRKREQSTYSYEDGDISQLAEINRILEGMDPNGRDFFLGGRPILKFALEQSSGVLKDIRDRDMEMVRKKLGLPKSGRKSGF